MWKTIVQLGTGKSAPDPDSIMTSSKSATIDQTEQQNASLKANGNGKQENNTQGQQQVDKAIEEYLHGFKELDKGQDLDKIQERKDGYESLVRNYYNLVTDFYEYGWGESFHFAPRFNWETFDESIHRHEYYLASRLGLKRGTKVIDLGCGVGGPMRSIARFSDANVTGVTICEYQVSRANALNAKYGLSSNCKAEFGDFMDLGEHRRGMFDAAYAVEATCHAPDRTKCFEQVYQSLKPGAVFAVYEWAMTPLYDASNAEHRLIKHEIEKGDSLPDLTSQDDIVRSFVNAGFQVIEARDMALESQSMPMTTPWYATLQGGLKLSQVKHSKIGRFLTHMTVSLLEFIGIAPKGTTQTHAMLSQAAHYLAIGGEKGIFTPMFFILARKPGTVDDSPNENQLS